MLVVVVIVVAVAVEIVMDERVPVLLEVGMDVDVCGELELDKLELDVELVFIVVVAVVEADSFFVPSSSLKLAVCLGALVLPHLCQYRVSQIHFRFRVVHRPLPSFLAAHPASAVPCFD